MKALRPGRGEVAIPREHAGGVRLAYSAARGLGRRLDRLLPLPVLPARGGSSAGPPGGGFAADLDELISASPTPETAANSSASLNRPPARGAGPGWSAEAALTLSPGGIERGEGRRLAMVFMVGFCSKRLDLRGTRRRVAPAQAARRGWGRFRPSAPPGAPSPGRRRPAPRAGLARPRPDQHVALEAPWGGEGRCVAARRPGGSPSNARFAGEA